MVELVQTGIEGLDSILTGGIPRTATVLLSGNPGTGKSILGMQYVYNGVEQFDENGMYLSFEENEEDLRQAAEAIGLEGWADHVENDRITVYDKQDLLRESGFSSTLDLVLDNLQEMNIKRTVLDSLSMFALFFETEKEKRTYLLKFSDILKQNGLTTLLVNEQGGMFPETEIGLENFLTDGNIYLIQTPTETGVNRYVWVAKMRKKKIESDIFPMDITDTGIIVHEDAAGFSMMGDSGEFPGF